MIIFPGNATICAMMVDNGSPVNSRCNDGHTGTIDKQRWRLLDF
jgi:hypothetical protein